MHGVGPNPNRAGTIKDLLHFITCGSVDDGKSTLIGRLLHDSNLVMEDELRALVADTVRHGAAESDIDFALLMDGLEAEREQGITIDVAYRFFTTPKRSFIVADTPGHEQYTRNMATGASNAEAAVLLVDARKGVLAQTRRHALICSLLGIRDVVIAINKMDLVGYQQAVFDRFVADVRTLAADLGFRTLVVIPISARLGDNVTTKSDRTPWYQGPALLPFLEDLKTEPTGTSDVLRFPVQWVNRPNLDFRGYAGTIVSGAVNVGDRVLVAGSGQASTIKEIVTGDGYQSVAEAGDAVTLTLNDEIDVGRGDVLVSPTARPEVSDQFAAHVIWMSEEPLFAGRSYLARIGTKITPFTVTNLKYKIDVDTREHLAATQLRLNDIAFCNVATGTAVAFDPYNLNRRTGSFIIIDRFTNDTVGAGIIAFGLRRGTNVHWQSLMVRKEDRSALKKQKPAILWFTGLSGAGKSTIANLVESKLHAAGCHTMLLDGDNLRHGLNRDLGFTEADRVENIRRAGEVAKLMIDSGLIVLCAFISPYRAERDSVRRLVADGEFLEIFVDAPIEECIRRDPKGLYAKAMAGLLKNFTGFDASYEPPEAPEIHLRTDVDEPEQSAERVLQALRARRIQP
jgi:bifunctional enzyme CysN/CysC